MNRKMMAVLVVLVSGILVRAQTSYVPSGMKGVPFSAEVVNETIRVLPDGNRIHQETHGKRFRDSEGRTRVEYASMMPRGDEIEHVNIIDPVQQEFIFLNPGGEKTATVQHMNQHVTVTPNSLQKDTGIVARGRTSATTMEVEDLGTRMIEGFTARGTRHKRTIAAGEIGNEKPLATVTESWYSDELQEVLLSETDDPQSGHHTTKLVNIQRGEPDPALFQIPAGYTVKNQ